MPARRDAANVVQSTWRQYSSTGDNTGSLTPLPIWPMMLLARRSRAASSMHFADHGAGLAPSAILGMQRIQSGDGRYLRRFECDWTSSAFAQPNRDAGRRVAQPGMPVIWNQSSNTASRPGYPLRPCRRSAGQWKLTRAARTRRTKGRADRSAWAAEERGSVPGTARCPKLPRPDTRTGRSPGFGHAVVVAVMAGVVRSHDHGAREEYDRDDENDPGDDHHPRRGGVEPARFGLRHQRWRRRWRGRGDGSRRGRWFRCFTHFLNIAPASDGRNKIRQRTCCELSRHSPASATKRAARRSSERRALVVPAGGVLPPVSTLISGLLKLPRGDPTE